MSHGPSLRFAAPHRPPTDGWLGLREFPGYRAGNVVARLDDLPKVDPEHLYFDLLLLDPGGRAQDFHSGPCPALGRRQSLDERSRFVRLVAELVRHAPSHDVGLAAIGQALTFVRECGIETDRLIIAAQLLDNVSSESAVASGLADMLELSLGVEEARREMGEVVADLARTTGFAALDGVTEASLPDANDLPGRIGWINRGGLSRQLDYIVRTVGKSRVRRYVRKVTDFEMVPTPGMFGV